MVNLSKTLYAMVFSAVFAGISAGTAALAYPSDSGTFGMMDLNGTETSGVDGDMWGMMNGNHSGNMGMITGTSNDAEGNPAWLLAGHWKIGYASNTSAIGNETADGNVTEFDATIHMVMFNGSAMHEHELSNFTQTEEATFNSTANATTYVGSSTITMREGPVSDVGTLITVSDTVVRIELDPMSVDNHFGDSPIYGIVVTPEMMDKHKGMMPETMTQETGNMTGTMHDRWQDDNSTGTSGLMDEIWE